jgi:hypothetical protein
LAVLIIIAGSFLGWIVAASAIVAGLAWVTAALAFLATSLGISALFIVLLSMHDMNEMHPH